MALLTSCFYGSYRCAKILLQRQVNPRVYQDRPLVEAAKRGDLKLVRLLLRYGADPEARGYQAILVAIRERYYTVAKVLLRYRLLRNYHHYDREHYDQNGSVFGHADCDPAGPVRYSRHLPRELRCLEPGGHYSDVDLAHDLGLDLDPKSVRSAQLNLIGYSFLTTNRGGWPLCRIMLSRLIPLFRLGHSEVVYLLGLAARADNLKVVRYLTRKEGYNILPEKDLSQALMHPGILRVIVRYGSLKVLKHLEPGAFSRVSRDDICPKDFMIIRSQAFFEFLIEQGVDPRDLPEYKYLRDAQAACALSQYRRVLRRNTLVAWGSLL
jgi:hypothetical protein